MIFIPSKGRPQCLTARYLSEIGYTSNFVIVVGDDDDTYQQYVDTWGTGSVVLFDKEEAARKTDMMDAFGDTRASGVAPARNAIIDIARDMGLDRCWLMDDDYDSLWVLHSNGNHERVRDGERLRFLLGQMEDFGRQTQIPVVGFREGPSSRPNDKHGCRVYCAHNVATDKRSFRRFSGRMLDDSVHSSMQLRIGRSDFLFQHMYVKHSDKPYAYNDKAGEQGGGMSEAYAEPDAMEVAERQALVRCRYIGYNVMQSPNGVTGTFDGLKVTPMDLDESMDAKTLHWRWALA